MTNYLPYVNPLQGTASTFHYSNGNTLPLVSRPFGMASWSPQTKLEQDGWFFHPSDRHVYGIRLTHQPSPWIGDYGQLLFMPQSGELRVDPAKQWSSVLPEETIVRPDYYATKLQGCRTKLEMTPTERGAAFRLTFDEPEQGARLLVSTFKGESAIRWQAAERRITGYTRANRGGVPDNFAHYFAISFDCEWDDAASGTFDEELRLQASPTDAAGERVGAYIGLKLPPSNEAIVRIGTSFISEEQAILNLEREAPAGTSFDELREESAQAWEERLKSIEVDPSGEDPEKLRTLYTCLYRTLLFPRRTYEFDASGAMVHYSPFNGEILPGPMYSDIGFWDVYRTTVPLYSLLCPTQLSEMMEAWANVYKESGWMPKWVSPGERGVMPGTLIDAAIADAFVKGIRGFDVQAAYEGLLKHAKYPVDRPHVGREGLARYEQLGYLPDEEVHHSVSYSLDYAYGDFCIAQLARELGDEETYRKLIERSGNYRHLFDADVGFMRARNASGEWAGDFDPIEWGGPYCEGGPWQSSWAVQHDLLGLAELHGGRERMAAKLDELFAAPPTFRVGSYGQEIHEMSEMAAGGLGQFAISNQPSFHIPYIYTALGYPSRAQRWIRETLETQFSAEPDGLPGDEDNGSLGAWYLFSAMGLYPLSPGVPQYALGSPLFKRMTVRLDNGRALTIEAPDNGPAKPYVAGVTVDGRPHEALYFMHEQLVEGARIIFEMAEEPAAKQEPYSLDLLPFSLSQARADA
ncbi:GH92 family glycosyl hydrolase [Cohnella sp. GCM10027633]|uniref:GH92 family glycosyl hydrolase n=1 Tax=unclassified Cohnella TaxID=2636738 RepID=UPI00362CBA16